ncbi:Kinase [Hexamita inflata]|uniref:CAMK CAMKL n=2 Tax=Hexamita inflata TaxID=28002 RepID=A0AA86Q564_9EUKA|nr:CAMK CAMKL [Hexamita inflata]
MNLSLSNNQIAIEQYQNIKFVSKGSFINCFRAQDQNNTDCMLIISENIFELNNRLQISKLLLNQPGIQQLQQMSKLIIAPDTLKILDQLYPRVFTPQSHVLIGPFYNLDMKTYLKDKSPQQKIELFRKILKVVQELHSRNIYHMDLKPSNIMMQGDNPILIDFGNSVTEDEVETVLNTSAYAPKQDVYSCCITSEKFDIYCLGSMLHEILLNVPLQAPISLGSRQQIQLSQAVGITATDLICGMTQYRSEMRYPIVSCLQHPFFNEKSEIELSLMQQIQQIEDFQQRVQGPQSPKLISNIFNTHHSTRNSEDLGGAASLVYSYADYLTQAHSTQTQKLTKLDNLSDDQIFSSVQQIVDFSVEESQKFE